MTKLTLIDRAFFLKRSPLFASLDLDLLLAIADKLQVVIFEPEDTIFRVAEEAFHMYFVVKGEVVAKDSNKHLLATLEAGEFFGDEAIFNEKPRVYSVLAKTPATLLALSKTNLLTIISECPAVAIGFLQTYTSITPFRLRRREE